MRVDLSYGAQFVKNLGHQLAAIQKFFSAVSRIVVDLVVHQTLFVYIVDSPCELLITDCGS
jgi:hypothetical protein